MSKSAVFFSLTKARLALSVVFSSIAGYILAVENFVLNDFIFLILDSLSENQALVKEFHNNFKLLKILQKKLDDKILLRDKLNSDLDYNKFLLDEFNELEFNNINLDEIQDKIKEADNLDQIKEVLATTINHLNFSRLI